MGVEHEGPVLSQGPLVLGCLPGLGVGLREASHTVHPVREIDAVPMGRGRHRQSVRHVDPYALAFHRLDHGAVDATVVAPTICAQA